MATMTKTLKISDGNKELIIGGESVENDMNNDLNSFAKPDTGSGSEQRLALNLKQIKEIYSVSIEITDESVNKLNPSDGTLTTKENARTYLRSIFTSGDLVTFTYGNETHQGYIQKLNMKEVASENLSRYDTTIEFLVSDPMQS